MIETSLSRTPFQQAQERAHLRVIPWAEMAARLTASRDLRKVMLPRSSQAASFGQSASFGQTDCAFTDFAKVRAQGRRENGINKSAPAVNLDVLGDRKPPSAIKGCSNTLVPSCDREMP